MSRWQQWDASPGCQKQTPSLLPDFPGSWKIRKYQVGAFQREHQPSPLHSALATAQAQVSVSGCRLNGQMLETRFRDGGRNRPKSRSLTSHCRSEKEARPHSLGVRSRAHWTSVGRGGQSGNDPCFLCDPVFSSRGRTYRQSV